jgi:hypothetical protein
MTVNALPDVEDNHQGKSRDALENSAATKLHSIGRKFPTDVAELPTTAAQLPTAATKLPKDVAKLPTANVKFSTARHATISYLCHCFQSTMSRLLFWSYF